MKFSFKFLFTLIISACSLCLNAATSDNTLKGKTLCVFGDSYVRNHRCPQSETWHFKAAEQLGMKYENYGRNGSSVLYDRTEEGFGPAMTDRYTDLPDSIDCLLIIAGHNDAAMTKTDDDVAQFRIALTQLLTDLKRRYPDTQIGYVLPWNVNRGNFSKVIAVIEDVCEGENIPVFNAEKAGGIKVNDINFRRNYFQDGGERDTAHLNNAGHDLIVDKGIEFIRNLMINE